MKKVLDEVGTSIRDIPLDSTPAEIAELTEAKVKEITGNPDPYKEIKRRSTEECLKLYPSLKKEVSDSDDSLFTATKLAIIGNVIDMGVGKKFHIQEEIEAFLKGRLAICDYDKFKSYLDKAGEVLYIADNSGESVFDRILIEEIGKSVTYVVRGLPIINDVTYHDALQAGIHKVARILPAAMNAPGITRNSWRPELTEAFDNAEIIISKGQANFESLSEERRPIFFLLKAKCHVIADHIGVKEGEIILKGPNTDYV
jgi:hypothetical protein